MPSLRATFPLLLATALAASPALAADAANGERIAKRWCAECHVVAPGQTSAKADAPPFATIAARNGTSVPLDKFLLNPHPKMPDMQLSRGEVADIVAYIATLKK
ncbi:cytochrome C552 [Alsobacter soli]|uniref:Cytochrome C552 n=2 Tax=Alsobacter soli TaxID=2109933 RepID=A0A2T1HRZ7_9HYPH|nr:cytochrome c [Alsobacter soli]PSC04430.1 cytochrome C552 [Alsobacter soli]